MYDVANVRSSVSSLHKQTQLDAYSKVHVDVTDELFYEAGNDTGRMLTVSCPWGTQATADRILARIRGYQHQPYTATGAYIDPATEIGDAFNSGSVYGGVLTKNVSVGPLYVAEISAPGEESINYKYEYKSSTQRQIERNYAEMHATFKVQADLIAAEVGAREEQGRELTAAITVQADRITQEVTDRQSATEALSSQITQQAGEISAKVSKNGGGSSFSWSLLDSYMAWYANGSEIVRFDSSGAAIKGRIEALSGKIGGFDIQSNYLSYNGQTWGGTNTWGIYIGPEGIQLGNSFKVDAAGNLSAASGTFTGAVLAGSIQYGGWAGTLDGAGLTSNSVAGGYGGPLQLGTVSTSTLTNGVNTSLSYADFANGVFNGWNTANAIGANRMYLAGKALGTETITYKDANGNTRTAKIVSWRD